MIRKFFFTATAFIFFSTGLALASPSNLVQNGSFENPNLGNKTWDGYDSIPGWARVNGFNIEIQKVGAVAGATPYEGKQFLELDSNGNGGIKQQFSGAGSYDLSFYYSARPGTAPGDTNAFKVFFGGNEFSFANMILDPSKTVWTLFTQTVSTTEDNPWLTFQAAGTEDSLGAFIDAVSLTKTPTPTPIPAAAWLFATGLSGLAAIRRKRKA